MNKSTPLFSSLFILFLLSGCYYNNEEALYYPALPGECDTTFVTYTTTIAPIMNSYCTSCHSGSSASKGIDLTTYSGVSSNIVKVYGSMNHDNGYKPMPNGGQLDNCTILKVKVWQNNGMPQ